ncbi:hypothetical protein [Simkania sp.]|uniref:hypothetical protein n=1 Tax=Simkania sp. TaxID=34094 RepID=UPI003B520C65
MATKLELGKQEFTLDTATPYMNGFVNLMHKREYDSAVDKGKYDGLHAAFETLFRSVVKYNDSDHEPTLKKAVTEISTGMAEQVAVSSYLAKKDIVPVATVNEEIEDANYGFLDSETGHGVEGTLVGIQVGDHFRVIRLGAELHASTIKKAGAEDLAGKFHVHINFQAPASKTVNTTSRLAFLTLPFTFAKAVIKWPFATTARSVLTVSIIVGVASMWFAGGVPSTDTLWSWGDTVKTHTWDHLPDWNATTAMASKLKLW